MVAAASIALTSHSVLFWTLLAHSSRDELRSLLAMQPLAASSAAVLRALSLSAQCPLGGFQSGFFPWDGVHSSSTRTPRSRSCRRSARASAMTKVRWKPPPAAMALIAASQSTTQ